jgi:hypothetical protein
LLLSCEAKEEGGTTIERRNTGEDQLATLARRMIEETDYYTPVQGRRGPTSEENTTSHGESKSE